METKVLIKTYEKLAAEEEQLKSSRKQLVSKGNNHDRPPSVAPSTDRNDARQHSSRRASSVLSTDDVLREMEYDQVRVHEKVKQLESLLEESSDTPTETGESQLQDRASEFRRIFYLHHNYSALHSSGLDDSYKSPLHAPIDKPAASSPMHNTNPFKEQIEQSLPAFNVWSAQFVFNTIARRAGYGNPAFFPQDTSSKLLAVPSSLMFGSRKDGLTSSGSGESRSAAVVIVDKAAFAFMKKFGVKRWMMKRLDKLESLADKAREKFTK